MGATFQECGQIFEKDPSVFAFIFLSLCVKIISRSIEISGSTSGGVTHLTSGGTWSVRRHAQRQPRGSGGIVAGQQELLQYQKKTAIGVGHAGVL
jgi:hypothetical protein